MQFTFAVSAQTSYVSVDYSSGQEVFENMSLKEGSASEFVQKGEEYALKIYTSTALGTNYRRFSVAKAFKDSFYYDSVILKVSYYDEGNGSFVIGYKTRYEQNSETEPIRMSGTGALKEQIFTLYDYSGESDLTLNLFSEASNQSPSDIYIKSIKIEKSGKYFPVSLQESGGVAGNQFFTGETPYISLSANNMASSRLDVNYEVETTDYDGITAVTATGKLSISKGYSFQTISLGKTPYGVFDSVIKFKDPLDDSVYSELKTNFSVSPRAEQNDDFGVNTHYVTYADRDPSKSIPLARNMGCKMIRLSMPWPLVEKEKGAYSVPSAFDNVYKYASENNIEILINLNGNSEFYCDDVYQNYDISTGNYFFPQGEAAVKAFGDYVESVVSELKGKVKYYQIWNEFQSTCYNRPTQIYRYIALQKEAYERAKKADPDCVIIGGTGFEPILSWTDEYFRQGGYNKCDVMSYHLYNWYGAGAALAKDMEKIYSLLQKKYSWQDIPVWITESGWSTSYVSDDDQYSNAIKLYIRCKKTGIDKFFYYDLKNDRVDRLEREGNFGLIYMHDEKHKVPYSAKPAYVALANMNNMLANGDITANTVKEDGTEIYEFTKKDGKKVWVVWIDADTEIQTSISIKADTILLTDKFGNSETLTGTNGEFNINVCKQPIYLSEI